MSSEKMLKMYESEAPYRDSINDYFT